MRKITRRCLVRTTGRKAHFAAFLLLVALLAGQLFLATPAGAFSETLTTSTSELSFTIYGANNVISHGIKGEAPPRHSPGAYTYYSGALGSGTLGISGTFWHKGWESKLDGPPSRLYIVVTVSKYKSDEPIDAYRKIFDDDPLPIYDWELLNKEEKKFEFDSLEAIIPFELFVDVPEDATGANIQFNWSFNYPYTASDERHPRIILTREVEAPVVTPPPLVDDFPWETAVGGLAAVGAAAAILASRAVKKKKGRDDDREENETAGYILQLNTDEISLWENEPQVLRATCWEVNKKGDYRHASHAGLHVQPPPAVANITVSPLKGQGGMDMTVTLAGSAEPTPCQVVVTASAGGQSISASVNLILNQPAYVLVIE